MAEAKSLQAKRAMVKDLLASETSSEEVLVQGWVRTKRDSKGFSFIEINDGSCLKGLQVIADDTLENYHSEIHHIRTGAAVEISGELVASQGGGQKWELIAGKVTLFGNADEDYPMQKKGHTMEFLRSIAHLRPRANLFGCVFRVRSRLAFAIHRFFQDRGFVYVQTPIITASDCEGAGEMFRVTTAGDPDAEAGKEKGDGDEHAHEFFGKRPYACEG